VTIELLVNIDVDDLPRAERFYRDALGLQLRRRLGNGAVSELVGGSSPVYLLAKPAQSVASATTSAVRDYARHWTPIHLDVVVQDLDAAIQRAVAAGAVLEGAVRAHDWGRIAQLADPFGHGLCLIQFSEVGYDAVADPPG
jgi:predicted enzyme related to lactoylglutathione lyase